MKHNHVINVELLKIPATEFTGSEQKYRQWRSEGVNQELKVLCHKPLCQVGLPHLR